eukprot:TRINITY_DN15053_c0_g1_i1.p1 TRINITY_DN15053_c0_g1~~TRINITY_DN15053_c0_g1_i1.p1  ORF type:complete len:148 (+),score=42.66 TRINITY_DN15053_c0_g1_i1:81-524(+)
MMVRTLERPPLDIMKLLECPSADPIIVAGCSPKRPGGHELAEAAARRRPLFNSGTCSKAQGRAEAKHRRCPLTQRLPKADLAAATDGSILAEQEASAASAISASLESGEALVCPNCGGVVAMERFEQHTLRWCPAVADVDSDEDEAA